MKNFLKKYFKTLVKTTFGICIFFSLGIGIYLYYAISQAQESLKRISIVPNISLREPSILEQGSYIKKMHLEKYLLVTDQANNIDSWLNENLQKQNITINHNKIEILNDINLPFIKSNTCERFKCIQYKVKFEEIPSTLWKALLGIEDFRFLEHEGVDYISIFRAIVADIKAMKLVQGGSTLTQQLVKNLFLTNEKKFERKIREIIFAIYLEKKLSKEQIITAYFNEVFWGVNQGIYLKGIGAASLAYFGKRPNELTSFESNILISMLKGPIYYHPINSFERLKNRSTVVYKRLETLNLLDQGDKIWSEQEWDNWLSWLKSSSQQNYLYALYLLKDDHHDYWSPYEKFVFYETSQNIKNQLSDELKEVDIAFKTMAISAKCKNKDCAKIFSFYSKIERNKETAIDIEKHQVGSILKPIIYEQFLELGKSLDDEVTTSEITLDLVSGSWSPKDASKSQDDFITLKRALLKSRNIPLIRTAQEVGFEKLEEKLLPYFPNLLVPLGQYPAQLLGAIELSLSEISGSYLKYFQNSCKNIKEEKYQFKDSIMYLLSEAQNTTISRVANITLKGLNIFGKTGTSSNGLDNWYIAFDGEQLFLTWFGVDTQRQGKKLGISGATSAFKIFQEYMTYRGKRVPEMYCL